MKLTVTLGNAVVCEGLRSERTLIFASTRRRKCLLCFAQSRLKVEDVQLDVFGRMLNSSNLENVQFSKIRYLS